MKFLRLIKSINYGDNLIYIQNKYRHLVFEILGPPISVTIIYITMKEQ